jgi:ribosomal protein S8
MVFYYSIRGGKCQNAHSHITLTPEDITCYVGRDKHENEYLIRYGWPGDVWFHVEGISSAHVYFRLDCFSSSYVNPHVKNLLGKIPIDDLPPESIEDMCQIVKHNSIKGCKMASCKIVYTPHSNLKKTFNMDSGTVTYHDPRLQRFQRCDKDKQRIKELEATKSTDVSVDYYEEMKANERRIIDHKKKLKKSGGGGGTSSSLDIYDPVMSDLRGMKAKAAQQGDQLSGIDSGLAFLEGLVGTTSSGETSRGNHHHDHNDNDGTAATTTDEDMSHLPVWQREANDRLENHNYSERVRFLLARGYTLEEIREATTTNDGNRNSTENAASSLVPFSVTLSRLWAKQSAAATAAATSTSTTTPVDNDGVNAELSDLIYEARNEEKEVLEAIYGEDDLVQFGWRNSNEEDDDDTDDDDDPSKPFSFDSIIPVQGYEPPQRYEYPPPLLLEIYVDHGVSNYPFGRSSGNSNAEPPVFAVVGGGLPSEQLRKLTDKLKEAAIARSLEAEAGEPQIFDLLQATGELAEQVVEEESASIKEETKRRRAKEAKEEREAAKEEAERLGIVGSSTTKLNFRSEADRRAYAKSIVKSL